MPDQVVASHEAAGALERALGDPLVDDNPLSFCAAASDDEQEAYPERSLRALTDAGLHRHYVPIEQGGALGSYETLLWLLRAVGRRDFTAAVTHAVSFPGAALVWHAGSPAQRARTAEVILGGQQISIAYHEKEHGNDFMATEVVADKSSDGYTLRGEKWAVANAARSQMLVVLARTQPEGGPRGFSLVLVDKRGADRRTFSCLDKLRTHGVRGQAIDGIRFDDHRVASDAILGAPGAGFELSLKCSQISRTLSLGPLLGAFDTALRATVAHMCARKLYGEPAISLPAVHASMVDAFLDLLLAECATLASIRAIHFVPGKLAVWAPAAKAFVTSTAERALYDLSIVMGSRFYLRDAWWSGIFQKIVRDAPMTRVSHFGGIISLVHLGSALPSVYARSDAAEGVDLGGTVGALFDVAAMPPPADTGRLRLVAHGVDELVLGLGFAREKLACGALASETDPAILAGIVLELGRLMEETAEIRSFLMTFPDRYGPGFARAPEMLEVARRHAALFAATAAVLFWLFSRTTLDAFGKEGDWLYLVLRRVRAQMRPSLELRPVASEKRVGDRVRALLDQDRAFSIFAAPIARRGSRSARHEGAS